MRQRLKQGLSYCDPNHNPEGKPPGTGAKTHPSTPARTLAQTTLTAVCSLTHAVSTVTPLYPLQGAWGGGRGAHSLVGLAEAKTQHPIQRATCREREAAPRMPGTDALPAAWDGYPGGVDCRAR